MFKFLESTLRRILQCLLATMLLLLYTPPEVNQQENQLENQLENQQEKVVHQVQVRLAAAGKCYLGALAGEGTVLWLQKTLSPLLDAGLNCSLQQVSLCFEAVGVKGDLELGVAVTPQHLVLVLQLVLLSIALYWPLSVAYRLVSPFVRKALKMVKGILSVLAFTLGFKRFPFSAGKLKLKLRKKKTDNEEEEQGQSQNGGGEKTDSKEKKSSAISKLFRRDKNKPKKAAE